MIDSSEKSSDSSSVSDGKRRMFEEARESVSERIEEEGIVHYFDVAMARESAYKLCQ